MNNDRKMAMRSKFEPVDEALIQIPPADVSHVRRKWLDLPYAGISQAQKRDIYLPPEGNGPFPIVLHIHGGAFAIGDKRDIHLMSFLSGLERGYAAVSVNYRSTRITDISDTVRRASPLTYVHAAMPPILIQHGRMDAMVPVRQSMGLVQKLEETGSPDRFEFDIMENAGHGDPLFETDANMNRVFQFLDRYLK